MSPVESFDQAVHSRPKRKLDDYAPNLDGDDDDAETSDLVSVRMRKDEPNAFHLSSDLTRRVATDEAETSSAESRTKTRPGLQFFIRMMSEGKTIVVQANSNDTVKSIHERIQVMTGIPVIEQRLIYRGKQLQWEQSLAECSIQNDAGLQLVGRMRSTEHPQAWQVIDDMVGVIYRLCKGETIQSSLKHIKSRMNEFFAMTPQNNTELAIGYLQIFMYSSAPAALVMLYMSPMNGNKDCADSSIRHFLNSCRNALPKNLHTQCAPIVLEFCKLLRKFTPEDTLYLACRSTLGSLLENFGGSMWENTSVLRATKYGDDVKGLVVIQDIFPFVSELASRLSRDLTSSMEMVLSVGPSVTDVCDFTAFLVPLRKAILGQVGITCPIAVPLPKRGYNHPSYGDEIKYLHGIFVELLIKMDKCLGKMEERLNVRGSGEGEINYSGWSQYLTILKELFAISKLYQGTEEEFWKVLKRRKSPLYALILRYAKRSDDHLWLLENKDVTNFECRRHLVMMMFPEVKEDYEELHEMLIDRSQLLAESFEYIARADPDALHGGLFMEFKNEEATGPGVLREWFFLVCQALFNQQNALFVACPNDRRRFYPNPASKVNHMHLDYFSFSGRIIALALMHKVQVGFVFDRVFFLQLAGKHISLEDIKDADPRLYDSCKQILEMDAEFIDSDDLGLTFVREVEELGSRKIVELCPGGKSMAVNSKNREEYVNLLIQHQFVTSISEQATHFAKGFADILCNPKLQKFFFQSLELEDLDWMLYGSESAICVDDWKAHTEYNGYKETDPQIVWFWKIVGSMSADQRKVLLFFWTSVKYLPIEGFRGLASRLHIYKLGEPCDRLPSSHTCFYRLCFPPYPSMAMMQDRLRIITQDHVGCSFGTW
ncbi:E3 ubiquitin-protein ligase UPL5-like [Mangifera indica]|uniref:E3 ubiquitin-protein ligase UPL5-like n=1 Tax=Mangifera indica TaxID=29780 RepID=UPI001CF9DC3F|nr:E3 ubiquitin-protein ligase UPL5-like [Mangifera indica]